MARLTRSRNPVLGGRRSATRTAAPIRHVDIPKKDGETQPLVIPAVIDRVARLTRLLDDGDLLRMYAVSAGLECPARSGELRGPGLGCREPNRARRHRLPSPLQSSVATTEREEA
jgi:hypothetical protein